MDHLGSHLLAAEPTLIDRAILALATDAIEALKGDGPDSAGEGEQEEAAPVIVRMLVALAMVIGGLVANGRGSSSAHCARHVVFE